jgi:hypothetical protein
MKNFNTNLKKFGIYSENVEHYATLNLTPGLVLHLIVAGNSKAKNTSSVPLQTPLDKRNC